MAYSRPSSYPYPRNLVDHKGELSPIGVKEHLEQLYKSMLENDSRGEYAKDKDTDMDLKELIVRPEWYGARGDGVHDDTAAIQAALTVAGEDPADPVGGKVVFSPTKRYVCGSVTVPTTVEVDGQGCIITATGTPDQIFLVDASAWTHHIKLHDFEFRGNSVNRIRVLGGSLFDSEIYNIYSRTGTVTDAIVKFYQTSNSTSPGLNKLYNISGGGTAVSGYHKYAIHFDKASAGNLNLDTTDFDNISLSSTVVGAATIRAENYAYIVLSRFNKIFFGGVATDNSASYVISGWFDRCSFSHIYGEFGANNCANCSGFYADCSFANIHNYNDSVAPIGIRCISALLQRCAFSQMSMVGSGGALLYASSSYPVITDTDTSNGNTISFPLNQVDYATGGLVGLNWNILRDYSLLVNQDVRLGKFPTFDHINVAGTTDVITDGGLELWDDATTPTSPWGKGMLGTSTVNRDDSDFHGGSHACRMDIDSLNSVAYIQQPVTLVAGAVSVVSLWYKTSAGKSALLSLRDSDYNYLIPAGTWTGISGQGFILSEALAWTNYKLFFTSHAGYVNYVAQLRSYDCSSSSIYFDDVSIVGTFDIGGDGSFVNQDVTTTASPTFAAVKVSGTQVVGAQAAAQSNLKADYTTGDLDSEAEVIAAINAQATAFNTLLGKQRTHGLIAT